MQPAQRLTLVFAPAIALLVVVMLVLSNDLTELGRRVQSTQERIDTLTQENARLSHEIASASSLRTVRAKAEPLGLTEDPSYLSIQPGQLPVALGKGR